MRKLLAICGVILVAGMAHAALKADVKLAEDGVRLYCNARIQGIEAGKTVAVTFRWTAPDKRFVSSLYTPERALGDDTSKALCECSDTGEKGCQRTRAYRTVEYKDETGRTVRAAGIWTVDILDGAGNVLGSGTYEVKK